MIAVMFLCVCVCVCVWEREREKDSFIFVSIIAITQVQFAVAINCQLLALCKNKNISLLASYGLATKPRFVSVYRAYSVNIDIELSGLHKMLGSSRVAAQLTAFKEGLSSVELVNIPRTIYRRRFCDWIYLCVLFVGDGGERHPQPIVL
jgi:hypothetical protein